MPRMSLISEESGGPGPASVTFDPATTAAARSWFGAVRVVAESTKALAAAARAAPSRPSLLRATAAAGASLASTAVSCAVHDASAIAGELLPHAGNAVEGFVDPLAAARMAPSDAARQADEALLAILRGRSLRTIADTIDLMERIDAQLDAGDGLKAFNTLYLSVTKAVRDRTDWEDQDWILALDLLFAQLYFDGLESCLAAPGAAPAAWRALMDQRRKPGVSAVQFALAGMNAHINRDLAVAVVQTWLARGPSDHGRDTPAFHDYARINDVLDAVEPGAMQTLATGLVKLVDEALEPAPGWAAMQIIHATRDLAFCHAGNLAAAGLDSAEARAYVAALDSVAADAGRAALVTLG